MQKIYLDLSSNQPTENEAGAQTSACIYAKQGDVGRKFIIALKNNGEDYFIPSDANFSVWYSGSSGDGNYSTIGAESAFSVLNNEITVSLIAQMLANPGYGVLCLLMTDTAGKQLGLWNIPYCVEGIPGFTGAPAEQHYTLFSQLTEYVAKISGALQTSGGVMGGALSMGGNPIADLSTPKNNFDAVTKQYADEVIAVEAAERKREIAVERNRLDVLTAAPNGNATADVELADIRIGYDGSTYPSAGSAVRGQIEALHQLNAAHRTEHQTYQDVLQMLHREVTGSKLVFNVEDLHIGSSTGTTTHIVNKDSGQFRCLQLPIEDYHDNLTVQYPEGYHLLVIHTLFDAAENRIQSMGWKYVAAGSMLPYSREDLLRISSDCFIVGITFAFSSSTDTSGLIAFPNVTLQLMQKASSVLRNRIVVVAADGTGDYTSVAEAVRLEPENTVILIKPGIYYGTVEAFHKRIVLIGTDRNACILKSTDGRYEYPCVNGSCGYLENLTLHHEYIPGESNEIDGETSGGYAFHCESEYGAGETLEFHHCTLKSDFFPALGAGLRKDFHLILDDCILENNQVTGRGNYSTADNKVTGGSLGALYFHDSNGLQGHQYITVKNCILTSTLGNTMCPYTARGGNNMVHCNFIHNILFDRCNRYQNNIFFRNDPFGVTGNFVKELCWGNSNPQLNQE